jgi:hypothetical protein
MKKMRKCHVKMLLFKEAKYIFDPFLSDIWVPS